MLIKKKDGQVTRFKEEKIYDALVLAGASEDTIYNVLEGVYDELAGKDSTSVVEVTRLVENELMQLDQVAARNYIEYRSMRDRERIASTDLMRAITSVIKADDPILMSENANIASTTFGGSRHLIVSEVCKELAKHLLPPDVWEAHTNGVIHYHDLTNAPALPQANCFGINTEFLTTEGLKTFADYKDGDTCVVPTHTGAFKKAIVHNFGKNALNKVTLTRGRLVKEVEVTSNHRWILKGGLSTTSLKVGHKLYETPVILPEYDDLTQEQKLFWCLGAAYADGSMYEGNGLWFYYLPLFGKKEELIPRFLECGFTVGKQQIFKGKPKTPVVSLLGFTKKLPWEESFSNIQAFMLGLLELDGGHKWRATLQKTVVASCQFTGEEINKFLDLYLDSVGMYQGAQRDISNQTTNFGKRTAKTIERKINSYQDHMSWTVKSIEHTNKVEDVWCLTVEDDHSFILKNGVVTGNCCLVDVMGMFEHGFTLGSAAITTPKSAGVAANVIAQIVNQVSSSNYGGTTIDHIDSLLEPYIKASYEKHLKTASEYGIQNPDLYARNLTEKEVEDAAQSLEYEVNSLINSSAQVPFVTVAFGMSKSWEGRAIQKAILKQRMKGLGNGVIAIFPKLNFYVEEGLNLKKEDPNYDIKQLALQCMTKAIYPDIISVKNIKKITGFTEKPISSMGKQKLPI